MTHEFSVQLPKGVKLLDVALAASETLDLGNETTVLAVTGTAATVTNTGSGHTTLGIRARTGTLWSHALVNLENQAEVDGDIHTDAAPHLRNAASVKGTIDTSADLLPPRILTWAVPFEESTRDASIDGDVSLAPGAYRDLEVRPNATLHLTAGNYTFRSLRVFPNGLVTADLATDPLLVYVSNDIDLKGAIAPRGRADHMFVGYAGTGTVSIKAPFQGTMIAPSGTLSFEPGATARGSFFARTITTQPRAGFTFEPFAAWEFLSPPKPILDCVAHFTATQSNALWSYDNPLDVTVTIPVGPRNQIVPAEATPITTFEPGRHDGAFWSEFHGPETSWIIGGQAAVANASSRRCLPADLPPPTSTSPQVVGEGASRPWPGLAEAIPPMCASASRRVH